MRPPGHVLFVQSQQISKEIIFCQFVLRIEGIYNGLTVTQKIKLKGNDSMIFSMTEAVDLCLWLIDGRLSF